ncbi:MAG: type toxin-antitoxin system prevent-host-death family antitoxin [Rhodoferax sp.]|nr:type toxin-antitoxin system prevent-host-death family antitoxin [Rhodoferax sp.]
MRIVSYSEARSSLKAVRDTVNEDADVTVISRRDGADAVVMSLDRYQSLMGLRRTGGAHRLVYRATEAELVVVACRFRYND